MRARAKSAFPLPADWSTATEVDRGMDAKLSANRAHLQSDEMRRAAALEELRWAFLRRNY